MLWHKFSKEEFYILYHLYLKSEAKPKGTTYEELKEYVCNIQGGDIALYEKALRFFEKIGMIDLVNGLYVLKEKVIVQCYIWKG